MEADERESEAGRGGRWELRAPCSPLHEYIHRCESHECATNTEWSGCGPLPPLLVLLSALLSISLASPPPCL